MSFITTRMTVREEQGHSPMEVVESPLNLAHQQSRKADRLVAAGKYEEAISCHKKAQDLLTEAMKTTAYEQAHLSIELQRDSHIKQQQLIQERWKRELRHEATRALPDSLKPCEGLRQQLPQTSPGISVAMHRGLGEREYDTLLYQLKTRQTAGCQPLSPPCSTVKTAKDDKTRLEEQQTTIKELRRLVTHLSNENQRLASENDLLRSENVHLRSEAADFVERSELWVLPQAGGGLERKSTGKGKEIAIPQLPPLEMPAQEDLCLDDLPPLELSDDIRNELQELLDKDKL